MNRITTFSAAAIAALLLASGAATAAVPEFPLDYDKSQIVPGEQHEVTLGNDIGGNLKIKWYSNPAYRCGRTGRFSLMIVEPSSLQSTEKAPLWVMLHGGGTGYYAEGGNYHKAESMNDEEDIESLLDTLTNKVQNNQGNSKDTVVTRRLNEGWRVMLPSMCDHDLYAGTGTPYPNNPNWGAEGDTVDGLIATMAAIDFTARGNGGSPGHPTGPVILHGQSAGAVGTYAVSYAFRQAGTRINGGVMDAYLISERLGDLFDAGITPQQLTDPAGDYEPNLEAKIGTFVSEPQLFPEQTVASGFDIPLFDIAGSADPFCGGQFEAVPPAQAAGVGNNCEWIHQPLAEAIAARPGSLHRSLVLEGDVHQPTNRPGPVNDAVDDWLGEVLITYPDAPAWPGSAGPPVNPPVVPPVELPVYPRVKRAKVTLMKKKARLARGGRARLSVRCMTSGLDRCRGRISVRVRKRLLSIRRPGKKLVASKKFTLNPGRRAVTVRVRPVLNRMLRRGQKVPVRVRIVTGSGQKPAVFERRVVFSRR